MVKFQENSTVKAYELKCGSLLYQRPKGAERDPDIKVCVSPSHMCVRACMLYVRIYVRIYALVMN